MLGAATGGEKGEDLDEDVGDFVRGDVVKPVM